MDAKDLRIETALGERNDGTKYSQSGVALQCNRNKSYQDIGSNPLAKAEAAVRPCAVIGPDRVVPPASNDAYLKKAPVDLWPYPDNLYPRPTDYTHRLQNNVNPSRNISPRQTFQENMQRIMVPPTYSAVKLADESNLNLTQDRNSAISKNTKQTSETKYCDVPYSVNLLNNEHKNVRETEMCVPSVNSPLTRTAPHGWPPGGVNLHAPRAYGADIYQYQQYPNCAGPRPPVMPMARPHRTFQEDGTYVYPDSYFQDASVRFKPYPSVKERYPHARYDYISNYPSPFHPPPPYTSHKYDIPNTRPPHPYPVYPHLKYLDNRVPDPNIEGYQRPSQQPINYNMPLRNQVIHPTFAPVLGNTPNKLPSYPPDRSSNKHSLDSSKAIVDYENAKAKYSLPDNYYVSEMARVHQVQKPVAMPNYTSPGIHPVSLQQYHRKDNIPIKSYEYNMPHYRHFEHPIGFNHPPQFSPSALAISPTDSNTSNDTTQTQGTSQEDCGYVSQSSTTSARSADSNINRLHNEYYRRYDYRYRPIMGSSQMIPKSDTTPTNSKENNKIDVRQFLSMWSEGDEESTSNNAKEIPTPNNHRRQEKPKGEDQLYVLGLVNVPSEELAKYEHIQKVSKLPENIKGYNNIELLNQFEEIIESSNMNNFKPSTSKVFMPMKDRKNAIKQIVEALPRPVSPLDVESKISQSVIHKEVGCNFEIKPCSPKMMNVEIASPVHNILGERTIEKVSNPLNKTKSPLSMRIDGNVACNRQRQESTHTPYDVSCKMIGSPFTANNMESVKTNYSLHDLETSSGVCLASLPRLDNEIELNFPEVNQQFINANKKSRNLHEKYPEEVRKDNLKLTTSTDDNMTGNDSEKPTNVSVEDSCTELTKLSQYRKVKVNSLGYQEDESNANAIRTDSVIIENPDNVRKFEENREKTSCYKTNDEEEHTPMNLTSHNSSHKESASNITYNTKAETYTMESALDFSLNKSEKGLPLIDAYDDELINTAQKDTLVGNIASYLNASNQVKQNIIENSNKPFKFPQSASFESNTKSIIVRNNQSLRSDCNTGFKEDSTSSGMNQSYVSHETIEKSDEYVLNKEKNIISDIDDKTIDEIKTRTKVKTSATNVIVKHKNKFKASKSKADIIPSSFDQKQKNINFKNEKESNLVDIRENYSHSKRFGRKCNHSKSVIQTNNPSDQNVKMDSDNSKDEMSEVKSASNNYNACHITTGSESDNFVEKTNIVDDLSINEESDNSYAKEIKLTETIDENRTNLQGLNKDVNRDINATMPLICDEVFESNAEINQTNKYYNDLISESELFMDKIDCVSAIKQSSCKSINNGKIASDEVIKTHDVSVKVNIFDYDQKCDSKTISDKNHVFDSEILEPSALATRQEETYHKILISGNELIEDKYCINKDELSIDSFEDEVINALAENTACDSTKKNVEEKNEITNSGEKTEETINFLSDKIVEKAVDTMTKTVNNEHRRAVVPDKNENTSIGEKIEGNIDNSEIGVVEETAIKVDNSEHRCAVVPDAKLLVDKKYSIDSGYQSSKSSFAGNDEGFIVFPVNLSEDSVFVEQELGTNKITSNNCAIENCRDKDILRPVYDKSSSTTTSSSLVDTLEIENKTSEDNEMEIQSNISSNVYDNVDANMEILFAQQNEEILMENRMVNSIDLHLPTDEDLVMTLKTSQSKKECTDGQILSGTVNEACSNEIIPLDFEVDISNNKMEVDDNNYDMQDEKENNISSNPIEITNMFIDESCAKKYNKDKRTYEVHETFCVKKRVCRYGKELYSPWIQKLIMYNEGKTQDCKSVIETKLQSNDVEDKLVKEINCVLEINHVGLKSFEAPNVESVILKDNVEDESFDELNVNSAILKDIFEDKSFEEPNVDSVILKDNVEDKLVEDSKVDDIMQNNDVKTELFDETNTDNVELKDFEVISSEKINIDSVVRIYDVNIKSLEETIIDSGNIQNNDINVISSEKSTINSDSRNIDAENKSLEEPKICVQNDDIDAKTSKKSSIDYDLENIDIEVKSLEETNISVQNYDIESKMTENSNIDSVIENFDVDVKSLEISDIESAVQCDDVEVKSLKKPNIESGIKKDDVESTIFKISSTDIVLQSNVAVKSLEEPNIDCNIQKDYVEVKFCENPINDVIKVVSLDLNAVNEVGSESESALIQNFNLKKDIVFDKINSETNTNNPLDSIKSCTPSVTMDLINNIDDMSNQEIPVEVNVVKSILIERENKSELVNDCVEECFIQNDLIDTQAISFSYPTNSIISQITENIFSNDSMLEIKCQNNNEEDDIKCEDTTIHCSTINHRRSLKRSFSDSALNTNVGRGYNSEEIGNLHYSWTPKRNRIGDFDNYLPNHRRNSVNMEESVSFCILIDDNCIITEENEDKICIAELQEDYNAEIETGNDCDNTELLNQTSAHETDVDLTGSAILEYDEENLIQDKWVEEITCAEDVFSDEVAENVVISAPSSPTNSEAENEYEESSIYGSSSSCSHIDKVKFMHGEHMSQDDAQIVETLYRTPHMNIMNKTLLYGDKHVESDNDQENIILESDDWKPSPVDSPNYIDPTHASNDFSLETPENKENIFVKELSPLRKIDDYLDVSSAENETDEHFLPSHFPESDKTKEEGTVYSCESSLDNVFEYKLKDESTISTTSSLSSSSPEVSSTTSEEKNSGILLKITNLNGSRVSQINKIETNNRPRCKFTEKKDYSTSCLNFPNRPLITKGAQKYIPPIKETIRDLKVKITLPQQSLLKLKQLKLSQNEPKVHKQQNIIPRITKKPKPNFDDVLKSIDEIQIKRQKEKSKKTKIVVPKVLIKKNENGSHYASTPKRDAFSPDLTGRKWQPWVFLEKNHFIDKMAIKNKTRAIFSHRKKTYVLKENFKKYKSVSSAKFVITQPKTPGQLKYTIRLKHSI